LGGEEGRRWEAWALEYQNFARAKHGKRKGLKKPAQKWEIRPLIP
jgi:hypothetical protein